MFDQSFGLIFVFVLFFFMLRFFERIYLHVGLPCLFSISDIAPLLISFHLRLKNMFSKITIFLLYYSITAFKILLQIFY